MSSETDPFADWPDRTSLEHGDRVVLVYTPAEGTRDGRPWADGAWRPPTAPVDVAAAAVLDSLRGHAFSTSDTALAEALSAAGASTLRHAHEMSHPLHAVPSGDVVPGLAIEPLSARQIDRYADDLGAIHVASYPVGHPDHAARDAAAAAQEMRSISRGELLGPVLDVSRLALYDHRIVGACVIVDREGTPPFGGPWVLDVFRDPACPVKGIGSALLVSTLAAARPAGLAGVSLAVSHENATALRLYRRLGFVDRGESLTLALPS